MIQATATDSIGSATFNGNTTIGAPDVTNVFTGYGVVNSLHQVNSADPDRFGVSDKRFQMYYGTTANTHLLLLLEA